MQDMLDDDNLRRYSFLGPKGTFTEQALAKVPEAAGQIWHAVRNVSEALQDVTSGKSTAAIIAIENSVDGGVSVTQDALARIKNLHIVGEYIVEVAFDLVAKNISSEQEITKVYAHPVAYAQCYRFLEDIAPRHEHITASSNVAAVEMIEANTIDKGLVAICPQHLSKKTGLIILNKNIGEDNNAKTRFVLVSTANKISEPTGNDKTTIIVDLPDDAPGVLLRLLEQFSTRGVNLSLLQSRPIGNGLGRYRFILDVEGHIKESRVKEAVLGVKRFSPKVKFLGSYPKAEKTKNLVNESHSEEAFKSAEKWLDTQIN